MGVWIALQCRRFDGAERQFVSAVAGPGVANIHFAGEHCSAEFQGYMEGGAAEEIRAANEVRRDLGA